jgi:hypothetical protein
MEHAVYEIDVESRASGERKTYVVEATGPEEAMVRAQQVAAADMIADATAVGWRYIGPDAEAAAELEITDEMREQAREAFHKLMES